jgi:hypothetical protein
VIAAVITAQGENMTTTTGLNETAQAKAVEPKATKKRRRANRPARVAPKKRTSRKKAPPASKTHKTREVEKKSHSSRHGSKAEAILERLKRPGGATLKDLMKATGWQPHSVRGYLSGTLRKKLDLGIVSTKREDGERCYAIQA